MASSNQIDAYGHPVSIMLEPEGPPADLKRLDSTCRIVESTLFCNTILCLQHRMNHRMLRSQRLLPRTAYLAILREQKTSMVLSLRFRTYPALIGDSNVALKEKMMTKRRALITGAWKGIGREVANRLAASDFEVIGVARTAPLRLSRTVLRGRPRRSQRDR